MNLIIGWLYPDLMSTYGDRGNIICLQKRCQWRNIKVKVKKISVDSDASEITTCDILFMGGAQDHQQEIVNRDLQEKKGRFIVSAVNSNVPSLFICGAYQFMGKYYQTAQGIKLKGLGLFNLFTESNKDNNRLIGNIVIQPNIRIQSLKGKIVGFENHGGRTYLGDNSQALATVIKGYGNNGEDKTEGIHYKTAIGTYLHGPILPKNPQLSDYLIQKALEKKYGIKSEISPLVDGLESKAREFLINKIK